uniref:Vacuolar fusion protein MON1 homolog n=1 Tax=Apis cerana TaxID=7461 RepID=V9ICE5_APICE
MAAKEPNNIDDGIAEPGIEPGASAETMLVTTDSFEEYEQEMSNSIDDRQMKESTTSTISEIQEDVQDIPITPTASNPQELQKTTSLDDSELEDVTHRLGQSSIDSDPLRCRTWLAQKKHVFILSQAGKPIYSRYSSEDKLVTVMGVMQALVSFVQAGSDMIRSVHAGDTNFVFVVKGPLILVAVSKTLETVPQLTLQLTFVYYNRIYTTLFNSLNITLFI